MTGFAVFRKCSCGFRTWYDLEERQHLDEMEDDAHEHKFVTVIVENEENGD